MGSSCTCIKESNENEVETFGFHGARLQLIIKIQKVWRGHLTRKQLRITKSAKKNMSSLNQKKNNQGIYRDNGYNNEDNQYN